MKMLSLAAFIALTLTPAVSFAQMSATPGAGTTAAPTKPAAAATAMPAPAATNKASISKSCSTQATAKGLHGKARKTFRSKCKANGGNPT
jgi:hypothetical protein